MKNTATNKYTQYFLLLLLPALLCIAYLWLNPFDHVLISNKVSLLPLTPAQRSNIELAAKKLDGTIIASGQVFSFNHIVGPRNAEQGYNKSPSYLEGETPATFGGGICLLSSLLYKSALELGLSIKERIAHTRTTQCIAPGFDATVWYGQYDLRFANNKNMPLKLEAKVDNQNLTINIIGRQNSQIAKNGTLHRIVNQSGKDLIAVTVLRENNHDSVLVSRDCYRLARRSVAIDQNTIDN